MFNGNILRDAIISAANNIANQKNAVDDLNVFPVPDGDTGTNMSMSIGNAARELERIDGKTVGEFTSQQLAEGVNIATLENNPGQIQAKGLYDNYYEKRRNLY